MKISILIPSIIVMLFGIFAVVYGGHDDSPGAQLIGLLIIGGGIFGVIKARKKQA